MNHLRYKYSLIFAAMIMVAIKGNGQTIMPDELINNTIEEQINFIEKRTKIYENYRAIREDMFQKINRNIIDTVSAAKIRIDKLENLASTLTLANDSLNILLGTTRRNLEETTSTKNKISVLGLEINKTVYNAIMWAIVALLVVTFAIGFLVFKRSMAGKIKTGKELKELKDEFEAYRQSSRIAREKMAMDHFNEIKKLKGT
ncbi:MAG: hypothetical protein LLG13_17945 [Bacteroidales bacterium]|nr:hypothetical protein [Bacteroidales bacterium]